MYLLFRYHNVLPGQYRDMGYGEKQIARAFMRYEVEKRNEEIKRLEEECR